MIDVQNQVDDRNIAINKVGIRGVTYPIVVEDRANTYQSTVGDFGLYVGLPHSQKGTHMSRFVEILSNFRKQINVQEFPNILSMMCDRLESSSAYLDVSFPYFMEKLAPTSRKASLMHYHCNISGSLEYGTYDFTLGVVVPITTVCPCSKEISEYGAHNQRGEIRLKVKTSSFVWFEELIELAESSASCDIYSLLKRSDEKFVTEKAYENPKFVEDVVRDVVQCLIAHEGVVWASAEVENFESIHNHSAFAQVIGDMTEARGELLSSGS